MTTDEAICGDCGRPATGFGEVNGVRYCHGDNDPTPTCYSRNTWRGAGMPGVTTQPGATTGDGAPINLDVWSSPESDPQALRYELDGCRAEIDRLRTEVVRLLDQLGTDPLAAILRAVWPDVEAQRWSDTYNGRDPLRSMVDDGVLTLEQAGIVEVLLAASSPVLGESGEGT